MLACKNGSDCRTNKEELVTNVKVRGRLGYSDHEMMEFRFLREGNRAESNTTVLDLRKEDKDPEGSARKNPMR